MQLGSSVRLKEQREGGLHERQGGEYADRENGLEIYPVIGRWCSQPPEVLDLS